MESTGGSRDEVGDTQMQYISTGTVDSGTREIVECWAMPGEGRSWAMSDPLSVLVGKLGSVKSRALVKKGGQLLCKECSNSSWLQGG